MEKLQKPSRVVEVSDVANEEKGRKQEGPRFVLGETLELSGTSYFPSRMNDKGKMIPAVYSGWHDDHLFRLLGDNADALNEVAPAWKQNNEPVVERGGQVVVLGTVAGKSCRFQEETDEYIESYSVNAGHLTGEVDIVAPKPVTFRRVVNG